MSKPGDVCGRFPEVYRISKYNGMGTESNRDCKWNILRNRMERWTGQSAHRLVAIQGE